MVDRVEAVTNEESVEMARRLAREEGILKRDLLWSSRSRSRSSREASGIRRQNRRHRAAGFR